jgi:hypothetical protein
MIDDQVFHSSEHFLGWWEDLNPTDKLDKVEALNIFYNLETYDTGAT